MRILIASSIPMIREGLRSLIEANADFVFAGEVDNSVAAQRACEQVEPQVILLHEALLGQKIEALVAELVIDHPKVSILLLADSMIGLGVEDGAYELVAHGVSGCVLLEEPNSLMTLAIQTVGFGGVWFSRLFLTKGNTQTIGSERGATTGRLSQERLLQRMKQQELTPREREVALLVAEGMENREIAAVQEVTERTIEFHMSNILRKLSVSNRTALAVWVKDIE